MLTAALSGLPSTAVYYRELSGKVDEWEKKLAHQERGKPRPHDSGLISRPVADAVPEVKPAMERLNDRPGKRPGFQTPSQVFSKSGAALQI